MKLHTTSRAILTIAIATALLVLSSCSTVPTGRSEPPGSARDLTYPPDSWATTSAISSETGVASDVEPVSIGNTLPELVAYALQHNPAILRASAQYQLQQEKIPQVTALPDPRLNFRYFIEEVETRVGPQEYAIGLSQPLPWFGKLATQGKAAEQAAQAAAARVGVAQNEVIATVANAWYELFYYGRSVEIVRGNRDLVVYLERVARSRYSTGTTGHPDVIRAQVELGKIENELASLEDRKAPLLARLNASLNLPSNTQIQIPTSIAIDRIEATDEALLERVVRNNPNLQAINLDVASARETRARAGKDFYPDFSLGVDYIATDEARMPGVPGSGDDPISASVSMTLPLQRGKYRAGVREAEANIASNLARRDELLNTLQANTVNALFRLRDAERQIALYQNTLLPKANESLAATQRSYSAGTASFIDLIDAQRMLLVFELAETRAITDYNQAKIALEKFIGASLTIQVDEREASNVY